VTFAWTSQGARNIDEFATSPDAWSAQSHLNSRWFDRGAGFVKSYLHDLKEARPAVPSQSTFFFFSVPGFTIWHSGPLVRWAYRDSSLRGYSLREFSLDRASRGPDFYFYGQKERLVELPSKEALYDVAGIMIMRDDPQRAREALLLELEESPNDKVSIYWLGYIEWALGDTAHALDLLGRIGLTLNRGPSPEFSQAKAAADSGVVQKAIDLVQVAIRRHGLDSAAQGLLADLLLERDGRSLKFDPNLFIAAFAARVLDPKNPGAWKRWGMIQYNCGLYPEARNSLQTYLALRGPAAEGDERVLEMLRTIPRLLPGGDLVQQAVRR
jgi:hypothetical protein